MTSEKKKTFNGSDEERNIAYMFKQKSCIAGGEQKQQGTSAR